MVRSSDELTAVLKELPEFRPHSLGELLISESLITPEQLNHAMRAQESQPDKRLGEILQAQGVVSHETIIKTLATKLGLPFVRLENFDPDPMAFNRLPAEAARRYRILPLMFFRGRLVVAMTDPTDQEALHLVRFMTGSSVDVAVVTETEMNRALGRYYGSSDEASAMGQLGISDYDDADRDNRELEKLGSDKPVVRFVANILSEAIQRRASDIHIRPQHGHVDLLFRVDGALGKIRTFRKALLPAVVSRIKIISGMNIAERRLPQDGRCEVTRDDSLCDLRVSVIPTSQGESVVIRILKKDGGLKSMDQIGFTGEDLARFQELASRPNGLLLVTGPTGSGKSTTLYAALNEIRRQNVKIITTENPVEYEMDDVEQIPVHSVPGYTFALALRHILRHDPDVIMVGEIRDHETAQIAVESSLTGHLVLSTLHTNSAAATITRMTEMGVEPYLLASTLSGVLAQRLVRRNCPHCRETEDVDENVRRHLGVEAGEAFVRGAGCDNCAGTGYHGRMVTYELLVNTAAVQRLILNDADAAEYQMQAKRDGMVPLTSHALELARQGHTSLAEAYRVRLA